MHFDDGGNPWLQSESYIQVFHYGAYGSASNLHVHQVVVGVCMVVSSLLFF